MDAKTETRQTRKQELLLELAELMVEEQVEEGVFLGTPPLQRDRDRGEEFGAGVEPKSSRARRPGSHRLL